MKNHSTNPWTGYVFKWIWKGEKGVSGMDCIRQFFDFALGVATDEKNQSSSKCSCNLSIKTFHCVFCNMCHLCAALWSGGISRLNWAPSSGKCAMYPVNTQIYWPWICISSFPAYFAYSQGANVRAPRTLEPLCNIYRQVDFRQPLSSPRYYLLINFFSVARWRGVRSTIGADFNRKRKPARKK